MSVKGSDVVHSPGLGLFSFTETRTFEPYPPSQLLMFDILQV